MPSSLPRRILLPSIPIRTTSSLRLPLPITSSSSSLSTLPPSSSPSSSTASPASPVPASTSTTPSTTPIQPHHDLPTFLHHATTTNLSRSTSLFLGTHYEYLVQHSLSRYGFRLARVGGRSDKGIDLLGHWCLPAACIGLETAVRVLVQCKAMQHRRPGPSLVRELEGALNGAPLVGAAGCAAAEEESRAAGGTVQMGVLCAPREATRGVREALGRSRLPLAFVMLEANGAGRVRQFLWNRAAVDRLGFGEVGVTVRYGGGGAAAAAGHEGGEEEGVGEGVGEGDGEAEGEGEKIRGEVALTLRGEIIRDLAC
ncbi:MAG: hypothetical protein M1816_006315 [Peltula sp. TS41687]|nr:MAG: hypothetical protein M1816_006315 [Peltula sp. TS41687]